MPRKKAEETSEVEEIKVENPQPIKERTEPEFPEGKDTWAND